ncbi:MAG: hypothetical protein H6581_02905 [Bacteroidia bacterium]|nr:hypothetical protein [Bacteroidia bacterium]
MDCINSKCCDLHKQAEQEIKDFCESLVYSSRKECFFYVVDHVSNLYKVDPQTGLTSLIGPIGYAGVADIAWDGVNLYGIAGLSLIKINVNTGAGSLVGNHGVGGNLNALEANGAGVLYAMNSTSLYTINKVTAAATLIGPLGAGFSSSGDLAFDAGGNLYGSFTSNNLGSVNPTTGAAANIGPFGFSSVWGLDFCMGQLYGITASGQVITVNTSTGAGTLAFNTGISQVYGMASVERETPVPCDKADLPNLEPVFTLRYGDYVGDVLEQNDVQCICITACNPYNNVSFTDVGVMITTVLDPNGDPVDPKNFLFKAGKLVCFGDLGPCENSSDCCGCEHKSCSSREFVIVTRDAKPGPYTIIFDYCFHVEYCEARSVKFEITVQ